MKEIFEKLSTYNIFNYLFPGFIFIHFLNITTSYKITFDSIIYELFFAYFVGIIISRIGSVLIESILKKITFINFVDYSIYTRTSKIDPKIDLLSEVNNMYRTFSSMFLILLLINLFELLPTIHYLEKYLDIFILFLILLLFLLTYRKQTKLIKDRAIVINEASIADKHEDNITNV